MIWIILIAIIIVVVYYMSGNTADTSYSNSYKTGSNESIPIRLSGIHPDTCSFFRTEEYYARLGEECSKITDNRISLSLNVQPNGAFSVLCSFAESARIFFPALESNLSSSYTGNDNQINNFHYSTSQFVDIIHDDAPSAQIDSFDGIDGKSFSVVWNPNSMP